MGRSVTPVAGRPTATHALAATGDTADSNRAATHAGSTRPAVKLSLARTCYARMKLSALWPHEAFFIRELLRPPQAAEEFLEGLLQTRFVRFTRIINLFCTCRSTSNFVEPLAYGGMV